MKILTLVHNHSSVHPGGTELIAEAIHRCLNSAEGISSTLVAGVDPALQTGLPGTCFSALKGDATTFLFRAPGFDVVSQSRFSLEPLLYDFKWFLEEQQPDVVHIHHFNQFGLEVLPLIRSVLPSCRIIATLHDYYLMCANDGLLFTTAGTRCRNPGPRDCAKCFPNANMELFASRTLFIQKHLTLVDHLVAPSKFLRDRFVEWGIRPNAITVVRNGWTAKPHERKASVDLNRFAVLGNLRETKGTLTLFDAFLEAVTANGDNESKPVLDVYGAALYQPDAFKKALKRRVKRSRGSIRIHDSYQHEDLGKLLQKTAWVCVPSLWWENAPLVINEAFSLGKPVLCSDVGGMAEAVRDDIDGLHIPVGNKSAWADMISTASGNQALWNKLKSKIPAQRTVSEAVEDYLSLYTRRREAA
jgi:glycosyltransferase involved in cell wall biosynthesis